MYLATGCHLLPSAANQVFISIENAQMRDCVDLLKGFFCHWNQPELLALINNNIIIHQSTVEIILYSV